MQLLAANDSVSRTFDVKLGTNTIGREQKVVWLVLYWLIVVQQSTVDIALPRIATVKNAQIGMLTACVLYDLFARVVIEQTTGLKPLVRVSDGVNIRVDACLVGTPHVVDA